MSAGEIGKRQMRRAELECQTAVDQNDRSSCSLLRRLSSLNSRSRGGKTRDEVRASSRETCIFLVIRPRLSAFMISRNWVEFRNWLAGLFSSRFTLYNTVEKCVQSREGQRVSEGGQTERL